jgi:hypothetical protein
LSFAEPRRIAAVYLYWGFDKNRFMPSRRVELQSMDEEGGWQTVSTIEPNNDHDRMAFDFSPLTSRRLRIFQPEQQGPQGRPFVMWMREVKVYGVRPEASSK